MSECCGESGCCNAIENSVNNNENGNENNTCQCHFAENDDKVCRGEVAHNDIDATNHEQDHCLEHCSDSCESICELQESSECDDHCNTHCQAHVQQDEQLASDNQLNMNDSTSSDVQQEENDQETLTPLGKAKKEAMEYLEALQRERADFMNYRARMIKEQERYRNYGIIDVLTALLPAMDDIDRIRQHSALDDSFSAVSVKIDKAFEKFGVEKFGEVGELFDPTRHEAVLHKHDENVAEDTVDTVIEAGYRIGDRIIRAARVVVVSAQQ